MPTNDSNTHNDLLMSLKSVIKNKLQLAQSRYSVRQISKWLWAASRGNRLQAGLNTAISLLFVAESLAQVWAIQHTIDIAAGNIEGNIYWAVAIVGLLILMNFALNIADIWVRNLLGIKAQNRMQQQMLEQLMRAEWKGKEQYHSGDIINRLEFDVVQVVNFITETLPNLVGVFAMFVGAFCYLFTMDHWLALIITAIMPLFLLVSKIYVRQMRHLTRQVRNSDSEVQSVLQETIQHRMLIKTLERESFMVRRLENTQSNLRSNVVKRTKFRIFSNLVINAGFSLGYLVALLWAALRMAAHTLTFGGMTAFLQLVNRIQTPAKSLMSVVPVMASTFTAAERLMELEEMPLEEQGERITMQSPCGVRLTDVSYAYTPEEGNVIDHLSFDFKPASCTAVLGETGAGKTTLVRMLLALLQPQEGKIEIYDSTSTEENSPRLRNNFVYVPQGNTLMSGTIRENLLLGNPHATDEQMWAALDQACAQFVHDLPQQLDASCTESGGGLSEGQAQRIAIARALLRNRAVMLFDEATSALDPETEKQLLQNILSSHEKTIIFITHRPAVVEYCDEVLTIEKL